MEAVIIKRNTEEELAKELGIQYIPNPPEGMTSDEVCDISNEDLWDMDYFFHVLNPKRGLSYKKSTQKAAAARIPSGSQAAAALHLYFHFILQPLTVFLCNDELLQASYPSPSSGGSGCFSRSHPASS